MVQKMEQLKKIISKSLKEYRKDCGITQEKFAEKLGISVEFYGEIERQKRTPSTALMVKMYHTMGYDFIPLSTDFQDNQNIIELTTLLSEYPQTTKLFLEIAKTLIK